MILPKLIERYHDRPLRGKSVILCTHAKDATVACVKTLVELGAQVVFSPIEYSRDADSMARIGQIDAVEICDTLTAMSDWISTADIILEDGARVTQSLLEQLRHLPLRDGLFAIEQTTSGIRLLERNYQGRLRYPIVNAAESVMKLQIENSLATPEAVIAAFVNVSGSTLVGKNVLLLGYGYVGSGIGMMCRKHGSHVTVVDCDPLRRMHSKARGLRTVPVELLPQILPEQDIVISCTANANGTALTKELASLMKDGAIIFNAGSGTGEIPSALLVPGSFEDLNGLLNVARASDHLDCCFEKGSTRKTVRILSEGNPINLRAGAGTTSEVIEFVFALMVLAAIRGKPPLLAPVIVPLEEAIEQEVAVLADVATSGNRTRPVMIPRAELSMEARPYGGVIKFGLPGQHLDRFSLVRAVFKPGHGTRGHYHLLSEEGYLVESGTALMTLWHYHTPDEKAVFSVAVGDYLTIPREYVHQIQVEGNNDFVCLVIASPPFSPWDQFFPG